MQKRLLDNSPIDAGKLAVVVGAGASGFAAMKLLVKLGARVRLVDKKADSLPSEILQFCQEHSIEVLGGEHSVAQFTEASLVVTSPGVPLTLLTPLLKAAGDPPCIGEIELGLYFVTEPIIGITGTSGKTTTTSLIAHVLTFVGKKVFLGGNIGTPLCEYVLSDTCADILVLELSSFQLQSCKHLHPHVGVFLNLSENHLDQHSSMQEYADAKFSLFAHQTKSDIAILDPVLLTEYQRKGYRGAVRLITDGVDFSQMQLFGVHNQRNAQAAYLAVSTFGVSLADMQAALAQFAPLPHRLERICEKNGVVFVNDSKSTTVDALRVALKSFSGNVYLLAGGKFKGGDLASLCPLLEQKVKGVYLYGASKDIFMDAWASCVPTQWHENLEVAMKALQPHLVSGDVVLLSPATASYDQYKNYLERGEHFSRIARSF